MDWYSAVGPSASLAATSAASAGTATARSVLYCWPDLRQREAVHMARMAKVQFSDALRSRERKLHQPTYV